MNRLLLFVVLFFTIVFANAQATFKSVKTVNGDSLSNKETTVLTTQQGPVTFQTSSMLTAPSQEVTKIYTDYTGYFTSSGTTNVPANQPDTENNLLAFEWNGKTWATGVDNTTLTSKGVPFENTKFRALKIFDIQYTGSTYFLQGALMDGSLTNRILTPPLNGSLSTPAELASRLTDGKNGLSLGTGIANIKAGTSEFKIGTGNINIAGVGDGKPDIIITQVAQPNAVADVFKFVDVNGNTVGNSITVLFSSIKAVGTYRLDLFNANNGGTSNGFTANETRDIRILGYDFSDFGINASNEALVDRLVINFSGGSDCAFIGVNQNSLKRSELSLIKTASIMGCSNLGDTVNYTFEVKNTGDVPIRNITLKDLNSAVTIPTNTIALLAPGATSTLTGTYVITAADVALGKIENSATVEGEDPSFAKVFDISGTSESNNVPTVIFLQAPPSIGTFSNVNCTSSNSGAVVLNNLPTTGIWTITMTPTVTGVTGLTGSGSATTLNGLPIGNYTFTVTNADGCMSPKSSLVSISDASNTTWNGSTWSNGVPDATKNAIINGSYTVTSDFTACGLTINSGFTITVPSGRTFTITNAITNNGQLIFENQASLVQINPVTNSGTIEYRRKSAPMKNFDYTYWSSPVAGQTAKNLSPNTLADKYFRYHPASGWVFDDGEMKPGVGFIIRTPKPGNYNAPYPESVTMPYEQPVAFKGIPNNGNYTFAAGPNQFNLVGNPYPSAITAEEFIKANSAIISGPLYFWTHYTPITQNGNQFVYSANDYATINFTGSTATAIGNFKDLNNNGQLDTGEEITTNKPSGFIAAGQSFFVGSKTNPTAAEFVFNNKMRIAGNNTQFFKLTRTKQETSTEKHRVWLNLVNKQGAFKQLLIGYISGATNDWDDLYDGETFNGQTFVDFYSINLDKSLTIQGRSVPFDENDQVPLGYSCTIPGPFEIGIDSRDGSLSNQPIWLEDKKVGVLHDLTQSNYSFNAIKGTENDRFVLKYTNKTLGTNENELAKKDLTVSVKNKHIAIVSTGEALAKIQIFDLLGRKVYEKAKINAQEWTIETLSLPSQILIVKATLANGVTSSQKIVF